MRAGSAALLAVALAAAPPAAGQTGRVVPAGSTASLVRALETAAPGDTVVVPAGVYRGPLVLGRPVTLVGEGWPVIDAGGRGHVIEATAPVSISGFVLRGSGTSVDEEHAGVMVRGARARIVGNRMEDVLYGVYLKEAPGSLVASNAIRGKPLRLPRRGDGVRLWYSPGTRIEENAIDGTRDVVVYFSDRVLARGNRIVNGRYGLHWMYSDDSRLVGNRLAGNRVGAFLMYSRGLTLEDNVFRDAEGASGMGLGLKDADDVKVSGNLFLENAIGIHLDNSPRSRDAENAFAGNAMVGNGSGVRLMPSVAGNRFSANDFVSNERPVEVAGGVRAGHERTNRWTGNHWSEYAGFDRDGDGFGEAPFVHARLADHWMSRHPALRLFAGSPAFEMLDVVVRFFPLLAPEPVAADPAPRIEPATLGRWRVREGVATSPEAPAGRTGLATGWAALAAGALALLWVGGRGLG